MEAIRSGRKSRHPKQLKSGLVLLIFLCLTAAWAQSGRVAFEPRDLEIFEEIIDVQPEDKMSDFGEIVSASGELMLKTPYKAGTLEVRNPEILVVNLRGLDCTTFVENALVLGGMVHNGKTDWNTYLDYLEQVRYRDGKLYGYPSRLHYFTDWIRNNADKGLLVDITQSLGGSKIYKKIDFMGSHPELYPALSSAENLGRIREAEAALTAHGYYVLPVAAIPSAEASFRNGDIIALATSIEGLDVTHTGLAFRKADGRIHLLHASTRGSVEISEMPLSEYLKGIKHNTGIIVARPLEFPD